MKKILFKAVIFILLCSMLFCGCAKKPKRELIYENANINSDSAVFHFLDVGQGDCTLITYGENAILIDAGTYESGWKICEYLKNYGIKTIDFFIGTHPHEDHLGGAASVLTMFDVKKVFLNGETSSSLFFERFTDALIEKEITPHIPDINKEYTVGPFIIEFISPAEDFGDTNNNSLVCTVKYKDIKALFTGDSEQIVESYLLRHDASVSADILKVGHHGSRNASSKAFLREVNPTVAVIECGKDNSYGHPHKETLERLKQIDTTVFRTDEDGVVIITTDGNDLYYSSAVIAVPQENDYTQNFIGNIKSFVLHTAECKSLPAENNSIYFETKDEALAKGYKPCGNCKP